MTHQTLITEGLKMAIQLSTSFHWEMVPRSEEESPPHRLEIRWEREGKGRREQPGVLGNCVL